MAQNDGAQAFQADATGGKTIEELQAENERLRQQAASGQAEVYDQNGRLVAEETRNTPDVDKAETVTAAGESFRFFPPKTTALMAFGMGASNKRNAQMQMAAMQRLLSFSLVEDDYDKMMDLMSDPAEPFDADDMADIISGIARAVQEAPEGKAPKHGPR
jgi:hypothetical protein